jgi:hypothetical protein
MLLKFSRLFLAIFCILIFSGDDGFSADNPIAYKLAVLHTRGGIKNVPQSGPVKPSQSVIAEFELLLKDLHNRCTNPDTTIADTMVETWQILQQSGRKISLLDTARQLSAATRNTALFGASKINFRMTSKVWLTAILSNTSIEETYKAGTQPTYPKKPK